LLRLCPIAAGAPFAHAQRLHLRRFACCLPFARAELSRSAHSLASILCHSLTPLLSSQAPYCQVANAAGPPSSELRRLPPPLTETPATNPLGDPPRAAKPGVKKEKENNKIKLGSFFYLHYFIFIFILLYFAFLVELFLNVWLKFPT